MARRTYRAEKIEVSLDGGICVHAALPTERLRHIQVVEIADDQDEP